MQKIFCTALALTLSGCNSVYQRPMGLDDTAKVRFVAAQQKHKHSAMSVYAHTGEGCRAPQKIVGLGGGVLNVGGLAPELGDIGMSKNPVSTYVLGQYFETSVHADKRFHFTIIGEEPGRSCKVSVSFLPAAREEYEVTYVTGQSSCSVSVEKISLQNSSFVKKPEPSSVKLQNACVLLLN
ncbi:hypothetical protein GCM10007320_30050 [Pseudorhodoferax aquiterrae]|uniref:Lipoprotein n=1 Tax=Pseudorhodoferax aquiterrae TaxID=747304 RepID=A0ABQ3G2F0_9BURK|nr:hypothetical protein [Pseudorhodoferax aquiterrae]GHC85245.1 hypothetical protein GCM10007320_30050 [Pseudorhodoferax aquiterrae]